MAFIADAGRICSLSNYVPKRSLPIEARIYAYISYDGLARDHLMEPKGEYGPHGAA